MKTIKYIDEDGLKEIFRIFNETTNGIVAVLNKITEKINTINKTVDDLSQNTTEITDSLNKMKDELSALTFDMGTYPESN